MRVSRLGRTVRRGALAMLAGLAATSAVAQEDPALPADEAPAIEAPATEAPAVTPDAERAARDSIDAYQVRIAETEYLPGRLRVADPITGELRGVRKTGLLIIREGEVVGRAQTGVEGVAQIKSLPVGAYSVVAIGPDGMAAFGFEVLPMVTGVAVPSYRFDTMIVPSADVSVGQRAICAGGALGPAAGVVGRQAGPVPPAPLPPIQVSLTQETEDAIRSAPIDGAAFDDGPVAAPLKGQPIVIRDGESGVGHLVVLDPETGAPAGMADARVSFIRDGQLLGQVETDSEGYCGVLGLEDGAYSMIGVGPNGFVAMGVLVETISAAATVDSESESENFVSAQIGPPVGWRAAGAHVGAIGYAPGFACGTCGQPGCCNECGPFGGGAPFGPYGGGGFGGGGGGFGAGGGGGFGGGGLLGALVGAGVGAAIGAAIADDDDDDEGGGGGGAPSPNQPPIDDDDD